VNGIAPAASERQLPFVFEATVVAGTHQAGFNCRAFISQQLPLQRFSSRGAD
jgi:hypothetical protein